MYSDAVRRKAMEQARDSDRAVVSGKVHLVQEDGPAAQAGFLMYMPVYRKGYPHQTLKERRVNIVGWVYEAFRMNDLMQGILGEQTSNFDLHIYDGETASSEALMYDNDNHLAGYSGNNRALYHAEIGLELAGHIWTVGLRSLPVFEAKLDTKSVNIIRVGGISMSLVLALLFMQVVGGRTRALNQVQDYRISATVFEAQEGMFVTDAKGVILMINSAFTSITGYDETESVGSDPRMLKSGLQDVSLYESIWKSINTAGAWEGEIWNRRKNGEAYPEYLTITAVKNYDGEITNYVATFNDITERKQTEARLMETLHLLEEKELSKTRFLAAAGHDLRQPVAAANLFVETLKFTALKPEQRELIERLEQSMDTFSRMLDRLLNISKFDAGLIKPEVVSFELSDLFIEMERSFSQAADDKGLRFRLFFSVNEPLIVRTDFGLMQSVLMNLVSNAIKYTEQGGILLSARVRGGRALVQVWDTGVGIEPSNISHIFDEFYQVANPQRNREEGLGLGLSICQRAVALLNTELTCRSRPGHGTVFELSLPLDGAKFAHTKAVRLSSELANESLVQGKRVVVVEDDMLVAEGLVSLLNNRGSDVLYFRSAEEALLHDGVPEADFFIADYALGMGLSGLEFLETLQQRLDKPIRAVILTGETSSQFLGRVSCAPWPVLHKPTTFAKLASGLRTGNCSS